MLILTIDLLGTLAFALTGAFRAVKHELDWLGVAVLACMTGIGGGLVRDVLLGSTPPVALRQPVYMAVCLAGAALTIVAKRRIATLWNWVMVADALGLGFFAAIGAARADAAGANPMVIVLLAGLTAVGGGVIRDLLVSEIPQVLKSDFYATAALIGGGVFWALGLCGLAHTPRLLLTTSLVFGLRLVAMQRRLELPKIRRLPDNPTRIANPSRKED
ncbi:MAG TPA: trimeric intracellular cation channel family protein [Fibrobacteria bacterium]|nr:trimeric intracellular cation channel family protein [Fibrobacteria bacterium]